MIININAKDDDAATDFLTSNVDDDEIINAQGFLSAANFIINFSSCSFLIFVQRLQFFYQNDKFSVIFENHTSLQIKNIVKSREVNSMRDHFKILRHQLLF